MKRRLFFLLILSSWICGLSLICLFPPVSDFSQTDQETGAVSPESSPELHLKNSSRNRAVLHFDGFLDIQGLIPEVDEFTFLRTEGVKLVGNVAKVASHFDTLTLFMQFFETY